MSNRLKINSSKNIQKLDKNEIATIEKMDKKSLQKYAEDKSTQILIKINDLAERIDDARDDAEKAKNMKAGWFGKTKKKANATSDALVKTNEALAQMNTIVQESIKFTCISVAFSTVMHKAMAEMVADGFKRSNGELVKLNESGKDFAKIIISQAEDFSKRQLEIENLKEKQNKDISDMKSHSDSRDDELERLIAQKTLDVINKSDAKDIRHDKEIAKLKKTARSVLSKSDQNDEKHDRQIDELYRLIEENRKFINQKSKNMIYSIISVLALCISILSMLMSMNIIKF